MTRHTFFRSLVGKLFRDLTEHDESSVEVVSHFQESSLIATSITVVRGRENGHDSFRMFDLVAGHGHLVGPSQASKLVLVGEFVSDVRTEVMAYHALGVHSEPIGIRRVGP